MKRIEKMVTVYVAADGNALGVGTIQNIARNALAAVGEGVA